MSIEAKAIHFTKEEADNEDFIFKSIMIYGHNILSKASPRLKEDKDFILKVASRYKDQQLDYSWISLDLLKDKEFIIKCVKKDPRFYLSIKRELKHDIDIAIHLLKVKRNKITLDWVPDTVKDNRTFMEMALKKGAFLTIASNRLRADKDLCAFAIKMNCTNYSYMDESLKLDPDLAEFLIKNHPEEFYLLRKRLPNYEELLRLMFQTIKDSPISMMKGIQQNSPSSKSIFVEEMSKRQPEYLTKVLKDEIWNFIQKDRDGLNVNADFPYVECLIESMSKSSLEDFIDHENFFEKVNICTINVASKFKDCIKNQILKKSLSKIEKDDSDTKKILKQRKSKPSI